MCGRFANAEPMTTLRHHYAALGPAEAVWEPSWNVCPTQHIPVLLGDGEAGRRVGLMRWGWNPAALQGKLVINCRGEEAHRKPLFQEALIRRRCVVPATTFYEWRPAASQKNPSQPFAFAPQGGGLVALAGFWEPPGHVILLTVPANDLVAPVHHRMPLVIPDPHLDEWLDLGRQPAIAADRRSYPGAWEAWAVDRRLSSPR